MTTPLYLPAHSTAFNNSLQSFKRIDPQHFFDRPRQHRSSGCDFEEGESFGCTVSDKLAKLKFWIIFCCRHDLSDKLLGKCSLETLKYAASGTTSYFVAMA